MRIAFVSYEFPPETGGGGIGTYLAQITRLLAAVGYEVEVFAGTAEKEPSEQLADGVRVHRIPSAGSLTFRRDVVAPFVARHREKAFTVVEGTDFDAAALDIKLALPRLPYVVKLHTPRFVVDRLHWRAPTLWQRLRIAAGALRRGRWPAGSPGIPSANAAAEHQALTYADEIAAPSRFIAEAAQSWASLDTERISVFPYPYVPSAELLHIAPGGDHRRVTFVGRLEERKGVLDLAAAIPLVLHKLPALRFRFVGRDMPDPFGAASMTALLRDQLRRYLDRIEFTGARPPAELPRLLAETDILAAPSHWESFGLVCCEGLAAARAVIGAADTGMAEILDGGACGYLVQPRSPEALAEAILRLAHDASERRSLGELGRQRILDHYSAARVLPAQITSYRRAVAQVESAPPIRARSN